MVVGEKHRNTPLCWQGRGSATINIAHPRSAQRHEHTTRQRFPVRIANTRESGSTRDSTTGGLHGGLVARRRGPLTEVVARQGSPQWRYVAVLAMAPHGR